ncbi:MAG: hypothetical protein Q4B17_14765 [Lautropia sp.]|nr:hypothetical protein [Lautropia sp.]
MNDRAEDQVIESGVVELVAVLTAVTDLEARVLTVAGGRALPSGPLSPVHRSLQAGVRAWVARQTSQPMGYVEQLYTFVDIHRQNAQGLPLLYIGYLGLVNEANEMVLSGDARWRDWYEYFPWEDWRAGQPSLIGEVILPRQWAWAEAADSEALRRARLDRIALCWGLAPYEWSEEQVLLRYELLYETGLIEESPCRQADFEVGCTGRSMAHDHRRVLATALSRLRAKIKYRPVIFELMPPQFTLLQLQKSVEALAGRELHKHNFRRQILHQGLIEAAGDSLESGRGRPAQLYRFRDDVLLERLMSSTRLPVIK